MAGEARGVRRILTRPANATAYTAGDGIGNAVAGPVGGATDCRIEFDGLVTNNLPFMLISAYLQYDVAALPAGMSCTLELYNALPTAVADNAAWDLVAGDRAKHVGSLNFGAPTDRGSTLKAELDGLNKIIQAGPSRSLFGILVAAGGFTPAGNSETLAIYLAGASI